LEAIVKLLLSLFAHSHSGHPCFSDAGSREEGIDAGSQKGFDILTRRA